MVSTKKNIDAIVSQKTLAMAGVSRDEKAFSSMVYRELSAKGYTLYPVNPHAKELFGKECYPSLSALPEKVGGVLVFTQPAVTEQVVRDAAAAGITNVWIQQGAESDAAITFCSENGLNAVSKECIMMFAEPVASFHAFHRWFKKVFGRYPR